MELILEREHAFIATHPGGTIEDGAAIDQWNLTRISALDLDEHVADALVLETRGFGAMNIVKASLPYNGLWAVDFTAEGVDKAAAARVVASMAGISPEQFAARPPLLVENYSIANVGIRRDYTLRGYCRFGSMYSSMATASPSSSTVGAT